MSDNEPTLDSVAAVKEHYEKLLAEEKAKHLADVQALLVSDEKPQEVEKPKTNEIDASVQRLTAKYQKIYKEI